MLEFFGRFHLSLLFDERQILPQARRRTSVSSEGFDYADIRYIIVTKATEHPKTNFLLPCRVENAFVCDENWKISNDDEKDEMLESETVLTKDCFDRMWSRVVQQMITQFTRNSVHEIEINITISIFASP